MPTVTELGIPVPPPVLSVFPTDPRFGPLKFTVDELNEFDHHQNNYMKKVRRNKAENNDPERYHVHQELIRTIITEPVVNIITESTVIMEDNTDLNTNSITESTLNSTESNEVMKDDSEFVIISIVLLSPQKL